MIAPYRKPKPRIGVSLIEVLVVILMVAILIGLLLAGVQKPRINSARARCLNSMRQLGLAILQYESVHKRLPMGAEANGFGWTTDILHYIEEERIAEIVHRVERFTPPNDQNHFDVTLPQFAPDAPFVGLHDARVRLYLCASSGIEKTQDLREGSYQTIHYYGCMGAKGDGSEVVPNSQGGFANTGLLVPGVAYRLIDIKDGTSSTLLLMEISRDTAPGSNTVDWSGYRAWPRGTQGDAAFCTKNLAHGINTTMYNGTDNFNDISPASNHQDGTNMLMGDGYVKFVSEKIDVRILRAAATRSGSEADVNLD